MILTKRFIFSRLLTLVTNPPGYVDSKGKGKGGKGGKGSSSSGKGKGKGGSSSSSGKGKGGSSGGLWNSKKSMNSKYSKYIDQCDCETMKELKLDFVGDLYGEHGVQLSQINVDKITNRLGRAFPTDEWKLEDKTLTIDYTNLGSDFVTHTTSIWVTIEGIVDGSKQFYFTYDTSCAKKGGLLGDKGYYMGGASKSKDGFRPAPIFSVVSFSDLEGHTCPEFGVPTASPTVSMAPSVSSEPTICREPAPSTYVHFHKQVSRSGKGKGKGKGKGGSSSSSHSHSEYNQWCTNRSLSLFKILLSYIPISHFFGHNLSLSLSLSLCVSLILKVNGARDVRAKAPAVAARARTVMMIVLAAILASEGSLSPTTTPRW